MPPCLSPRSGTIGRSFFVSFTDGRKLILWSCLLTRWPKHHSLSLCVKLWTVNDIAPRDALWRCTDIQKGSKSCRKSTTARRSETKRQLAIAVLFVFRLSIDCILATLRAKATAETLVRLASCVYIRATIVRAATVRVRQRLSVVWFERRSLVQRQQGWKNLSFSNKF